MTLPRDKECPWTGCGRKWSSLPATYSECPGCGTCLVDLEPGDEDRRVEHIECLECWAARARDPGRPVDFVVRGTPDWSTVWCPRCGGKCQECGTRFGNPAAWRRNGCPKCGCKLLDATGERNWKWVGTGHFEWLSHGWWRDPVVAVDDVYATTARKTLVCRLEREEGGRYSTNGAAGLCCPVCGHGRHLLVCGACTGCRRKFMAESRFDQARFDLAQIRRNAKVLEGTLLGGDAPENSVGLKVAREALAMADRLESLAELARECPPSARKPHDALRELAVWSVKE